MPIGGQNNRVRITRIELRDGKFQEWVGQGQEPRTYDWVQGILCGIATREQPMKDGNIFVYCDIHLRSDEGERFCISTIASSGITGDIISRLVNVKELTSVLVFSAWKKDRTGLPSGRIPPSFHRCPRGGCSGAAPPAPRPAAPATGRIPVGCSRPASRW